MLSELLFKSLLPKDVDSHLDIGSYSAEQWQIKHSPAKTILSCEIDENRIAHCRKPCLFGNILDFKNYLQGASFELITALDVIEHVSKDHGYEMIKMLESLSVGRIIFATPNGEWCVGGLEKYHSHKCGWEPREFVEMGYSVALIPKMHGTGWFFAAKNTDSLPIEKPTISSSNEWVWIEGEKL